MKRQAGRDRDSSPSRALAKRIREREREREARREELPPPPLALLLAERERYHSHRRSRSREREREKPRLREREERAAAAAALELHHHRHHELSLLGRPPLRTTAPAELPLPGGGGRPGTLEYKTLLISSLGSQVSDEDVEDMLFHEFKKFGDVSVKLSHTPELGRIAYVNFRHPEDAKEARHAKSSRLVLGDRPLKVEPMYVRKRSVTPPDVGYLPLHAPYPYRQRSLSPPGPGVRDIRDIRARQYALESLGLSRERERILDYYGMLDERGRPYGFPPIPVVEDIKPEDDQRATSNLFIGNLEHNVQEAEIRRSFDKYGIIEDVVIKRPVRGQGGAYAFVKYQNLDMALRAKVAMQGRLVIGGNQVKIGYGKANPTTRLWVGGLGPGTSLAALAREFDRFGSIRNVDYVKGDTFAYIQYESLDAAQAACGQMRGFPLGGPERRLRVDFAKVEESPTLRPLPPGFQPPVVPLPAHYELLAEGFGPHRSVERELRGVRDRLSPPALGLLSPRERERALLERDFPGSPTRSLERRAVGSPTRSLERRAVGSPTRSLERRAVGSPTRSLERRAVGSPTRSLERRAVGSPTRSLERRAVGSPPRSLERRAVGSPTRSLERRAAGSPTRSLERRAVGSPTRSLERRAVGSPNRSLERRAVGSPNRSLERRAVGSAVEAFGRGARAARSRSRSRERWLKEREERRNRRRSRSVSNDRKTDEREREREKERGRAKVRGDRVGPVSPDASPDRARVRAPDSTTEPRDHSPDSGGGGLRPSAANEDDSAAPPSSRHHHHHHHHHHKKSSSDHLNNHHHRNSESTTAATGSPSAHTDSRTTSSSSSPVTTLSEFAQVHLSKSWHGFFALKNSSFPTDLYLMEGGPAFFNSMMTRDSLKPPQGQPNQLKIAQRLRMDQTRLDEVTRRIKQGRPSSYAILLALQGPIDRQAPPPEPGLQVRLLRHLVTYLRNKEAAGVISLPATKEGASGAMLYAFPPGEFSQQYLQAAKRTVGNLDEEHMVVVIVSDTG